MRFPRFFGAGTPADAGSSPFPLAAKAVVEHEKIVFIALILLYLLPLWFFPFFPTQDGGSHLFNAEVIRQYHDPSRTDLRKHFDLTNDLDPYWTSNLVLGALLSIVPPLIAEKLLVTLYLVLFPVSLRYLVKS
ncbi:MAG TPA: hypothetical protein VL404_01190, partial [Candidatus Eisenbacteria bacterium]|nr:hypothetical protein [Candidatus Eisenbacteria bacterium]